MDVLGIFIVGMVAGIITGVIVERIVSPRSDNEDPTGEKKQAIYDTLRQIKSDLEQTV